MTEHDAVGRPSVADREARHTSGGVSRRPVTIVRGSGARLFDDTGRDYVDCASAQGWAGLGHSHPEITKAIQHQAALLVAHTESSYNDQRAAWFEELTAALNAHLAPTDRGTFAHVLPTNSGTEAIEGAIKLARVTTGRTRFVAMNGGFHGRTLGALSATGNPKHRRPFEPLLPGFTHVPFNDGDALDAAVDGETAGVIVEAIQGEGGVHVARPSFLERARSVCDERGALLIVDEIQTGLGRTGRWFACEHLDLAPDVIVLGKVLGGGIPMGAAVWREAVGTFQPGQHGSTFAGNPLACAAGRAVLRVLRDEGLPERAAALGAELFPRLRACTSPMIREVRGLGLIAGIELRQRVTPVLARLMEEGIWALPAGLNVLRLLPPLVIPEADLHRAVDTVCEVLET